MKHVQCNSVAAVRPALLAVHQTGVIPRFESKVGHATPITLDAQQAALKEAVSSFLAAMFSSSVAFPFGVVTTRLQLPGTKYKGSWDCLSGIVHDEGLGGLYTGVTIEMARNSLQNFIYQFCYTYLKRVVQEYSGRRDIGYGWGLTAGTLAGGLTATVTNPINVIQTRMLHAQTHGQASSFFGTFKQLLFDEGPLSLERGLVPSLVLAINPAINNLVADRLKLWWSRRRSDSARHGTLEYDPHEKRSLSALELFVIGALGKVLATVLTHPYIVAKTRLHVKDNTYTGLWDVLTKTYQKEGVSGLYLGLASQVLKSVLAAALLYMAKEKISEFADWFLEYLQSYSAESAVKKATNSNAPIMLTSTNEVTSVQIPQQEKIQSSASLLVIPTPTMSPPLRDPLFNRETEEMGSTWCKATSSYNPTGYEKSVAMFATSSSAAIAPRRLMTETAPSLSFKSSEPHDCVLIDPNPATTALIMSPPAAATPRFAMASMATSELMSMSLAGSAKAYRWNGMNMSSSPSPVPSFAPKMMIPEPVVTSFPRAPSMAK